MTEPEPTDFMQANPRLPSLDEVFADIERRRIRRLEWLAEALSRAECRRQGIDPDEVIADGGHLAWHLVGYEAAQKELLHAD